MYKSFVSPLNDAVYPYRLLPSYGEANPPRRPLRSDKWVASTSPAPRSTRWRRTKRQSYAPDLILRVYADQDSGRSRTRTVWAPKVQCSLTALAALRLRFPRFGSTMSIVARHCLDDDDWAHKGATRIWLGNRRGRRGRMGPPKVARVWALSGGSSSSSFSSFLVVEVVQTSALTVAHQNLAICFCPLPPSSSFSSPPSRAQAV